MPRFQISSEEAAKNVPCIHGGDARHICKVLRLKPGDAIELFDGEGHDYEARIATVAANRVTVSVIRRLTPRRESCVKITIAQGFLKEKKMDRLVRQLTEIGIARWQPFKAARSIPTPDAKRLAKREARWRKIAQEALKQCGRNVAPEISGVISLAMLLKEIDHHDLSLLFWEKERVSLKEMAALREGALKTILIILGPEGGFEPREVEELIARGALTAGLGPRILRAETATIAAATLVQYIFGDMGKFS